MIKDNGDEFINEQYLFHGTKERYVENIARNNFDISLSGQNLARYGKGKLGEDKWLVSPSAKHKV